jgi:hypothetical protein
MDQLAREMIIRDPSQHLKEAVRILCENRCAYTFREAEEVQVIAAVRQKGLLSQLVYEVLAILNGSDGNLRVGAAELLGTVAPPSLRKLVITELENHLTDNFIRDFAYAGAQGDEEDMRTVAGAAKHAIHRLQSEEA